MCQHSKHAWSHQKQIRNNVLGVSLVMDRIVAELAIVDATSGSSGWNARAFLATGGRQLPVTLARARRMFCFWCWIKLNFEPDCSSFVVPAVFFFTRSRGSMGVRSPIFPSVAQRPSLPSPTQRYRWQREVVVAYPRIKRQKTKDPASS